ncbi:MAG: ABC transporter permease [Candidatus Altimarinota bacterium]
MTHSFGRVVDSFFWPVLDLLIWGLTFVYLESNTTDVSFSSVIIGSLILWTLIYTIQRDLTISFIQDVWDQNLYNIFASPLLPTELMIGGTIVAFVKSAFIAVIMGIGAYTLYGFNILDIFPLIAWAIVIITLFGIVFGILSAAFIYRMGRNVEILCWSALAIVMPLVCVYYPVSALPSFLQPVAWSLPPTYLFEAIRNFLQSGTIPSVMYWAKASGVSLLYLVAALLFFNYSYRHAKRRGWFVKMD